MRLPRVRFTIRSMMVAVAIFGATAGLGRLVYRTIVQYAIAEHDAYWEVEYRRAAAEGRTIAGLCYFSYGTPPTTETLALYTRMSNYHGFLKRLHLRYARYPWLQIKPDPPEPK